MGDKNLISLNKAQVIIGILVSVLIPVVSLVGAGYQSVSALNDQINEVRLESYKNFLQKDELKDVRSKLEQMDGKLNRIEGYLSRKIRREE